jgi:sulfoxide reductase heme-binding subunit YedZ
VAAVVPFGSYYRTLWLGLGTIAFELLLAIIATSLLRRHIGARTWRAIHWLAYASWPIAVLHGIGTGTDSSALWMRSIDVLCVAAVLIALAWRLRATPPDPLADERRVAAERASFGGTSR